MQFNPTNVRRKDSELYRILDNEGTVINQSDLPNLSDGELIDIYRDMVFARKFDDRAISLQRQGRLGTYPPIAGQEASQIASTYALREDDWIFPTYRENAVPFARDVGAANIIEYWRGFEEGNIPLTQSNIFPYNIVVGGLIPHAVGKAMAINLRNQDDRLVVCHFGDGASSEGDFHEGMNFAGVFDVPCIFICHNNQWAISMPREKQTASETIAQKAIGYGFRGVRVDGMDPLAVYVATKKAAKRARDPGDNENKPTLIEMVQYRLRQHTTADNPKIYREEDEVEEWKKRDPIPRMEKFLVETNRLDSMTIDSIHSSVKKQINEAVKSAAKESDATPEPMIDHVFEQPTDRLRRQYEWLSSVREEHMDN